VIYSWLACHEYNSKAKREQKRASVSDELASSFSSKYARLRNAAQSLVPRKRAACSRRDSRAYIRNLAAITTTYHGKNAHEVVAGGETRCYTLGAIHLNVVVRLEITMWICQFYSDICWCDTCTRVWLARRPRVATLGRLSKLRAKMTTGREKVPTYIIVNCVYWYLVHIKLPSYISQKLVHFSRNIHLAAGTCCQNREVSAPAWAAPFSLVDLIPSNARHELQHTLYVASKLFNSNKNKTVRNSNFARVYWISDV